MKKIKIFLRWLFAKRRVRTAYIVAVRHLSWLGRAFPRYWSNFELLAIAEERERIKGFDARALDARLARLAAQVKIASYKTAQDKIAYISTYLYDVGGHTPCVFRRIECLSSHYEQHLFISSMAATERLSPNSLKKARELCSVHGYCQSGCSMLQNAKVYAERILSTGARALFVFIHPTDALSALVLAILRRQSDIRIIFSNHASHYANLGMEFGHVITEGTQTTKRVTEEQRHLAGRCRILGLPSLRKDATRYYTTDERMAWRRGMGLPEGVLVSMSGGADYKFFERGGSPYFEMIKRLLEKEPCLWHVVATELSDKSRACMESIFEGCADVRSRLLIIPLQRNFDLLFQCADVFVDSFPVSSALTQVDLMRNKVASVVKINTENPELTFHEYLPPNYPCMFERVEDMEAAVLELLHDGEKRAALIELNYSFWLNTYELETMKKKYIDLIEAKEI